MLIVKRANCERKIPEEKLNEFLNLGYSLINEKGEVLQKGKANSKEDLLAAFNESQKENAELRTELEKLKVENDALKVEIESLKKDGDGKFKCPYCDKEYSSQASLDKHLKEKHADKLGADGTNAPE